MIKVEIRKASDLSFKELKEFKEKSSLDPNIHLILSQNMITR
jgi:hypothetical protein